MSEGKGVQYARIMRRIKRQYRFEVDGLVFWLEPIPRKPPFDVCTSCIRPATWPDEDDDVIFEALEAHMRGWS